MRAIAKRFPPWELFRLKNTGQRVVVAGFNEDGTVTVDVRPDFNLMLFGVSVFGINPDDLEPCDIPGDDVPVGALMTHAEAEENIDALRVAIRPDLFEMGPDGTAVRKDN